MNEGTYIAIFRLSRPRRIQVGRLGRFDFAAGVYFYVGSARKNLNARLARHGRRTKPTRWHIDYLSTKAVMLGAIVADAAAWPECGLAAAMAKTYLRPVAHFGSSDCRCGGHLFYRDDLP